MTTTQSTPSELQADGLPPQKLNIGDRVSWWEPGPNKQLHGKVIAVELQREYTVVRDGKSSRQYYGNDSDFELVEAAPTPPPQEAPAPVQGVEIDVETLLRECVPGGSICDPQQVADAIREYFANGPAMFTRRVASGEVTDAMLHAAMTEPVGNAGSQASDFIVTSDEATIEEILGAIIKAALSASPTRAQAASAGDEVRRLLALISGQSCQNFTCGIGSCYRLGKREDAKDGADRCCDSCIAARALEQLSADSPSAYIAQYRLNGETHQELAWDQDRDDREYVPLYLHAGSSTVAASAGEPVAWQYRYRLWGSGEWSAWYTIGHDETHRNEGWEYRPLYAAPTDVAAYREVTLEDVSKLGIECPPNFTDYVYRKMLDRLRSINAVILDPEKT